MKGDKQPPKTMTTEEKAVNIRNFTHQGAALKHELNRERITHDGIIGQLSAPCFKMYPDIIESDVFKMEPEFFTIASELSSIDFEKCTDEQKQMILMMLTTGLYLGTYKKLCDAMHLSDGQQEALGMFRDEFYDETEKKILLREVLDYLIQGTKTNEERRQRVALYLMGADVKKLRSNIVPALKDINTAKYQKLFHQTFDVYYPQRWYNLTYMECAKLCANPYKNIDKISDKKSYMLSSLGPESLPSLFRLLHGLASDSFEPRKVDHYFTNYISVSHVQCIFNYLWNGNEQTYFMKPALMPYVKAMCSGLNQSRETSAAKISGLQSEITAWENNINAMNALLPSQPEQKKSK